MWEQGADFIVWTDSTTDRSSWKFSFWAKWYNDKYLQKRATGTLHLNDK